MAGGVHEPAHFLPRSFVGIGGALTQGVHTPVDVGVIVLLVVRYRVDHSLRPLGRGGVVQARERGSAGQVHGAVVERVRVRSAHRWHDVFSTFKATLGK